MNEEKFILSVQEKKIELKRKCEFKKIAKEQKTENQKRKNRQRSLIIFFFEKYLQRASIKKKTRNKRLLNVTKLKN